MNEYGAPKDGVRQSLSARLFMQLFVFTACPDASTLKNSLQKLGVDSVLYADVNDPKGVGVLFMSQNPSDFIDKVRPALLESPFSALVLKPEWTMMGRTYSLGYENDLEDWLIRKPRRNAFNPSLNWAVWYPLRRKGTFEAISKEEQRAILMEHAQIGMGYGSADLAYDIRLACHGLDARDNEFVLGVVAHDLHPISRLIQDMRKTKQTSEFIEAMGPFFVAKVIDRFPAQ